MKKTSFFWRTGLWAILSLAFLGIVCAVLFYVYLESQLPDVESLKTVQLEVPLQIYSKDGLLIQEYGEKKRIPVAYAQIPKTLTQALLVTEDQRFFEHPGVDIFGLGRAAIRMIQTGTKSQGGSTITMQVARNFFLDRKKTFLRKFNEILLAIKIDRELSKEKILELYLNKIYLGNRAYGVEAAAQVYYGKTLKELSLAQLAMIAGLPQAPSTQNPIANPKAAKNRRNHVLDRMLEEHIITQVEHDNAIEEPIAAYFHTTTLEARAPYVAEMIRQSLYEQFGPETYTRGYKVYSTIDSALQKEANKSVENNLLAYDRRHGYRGPTAHTSAINPSNESILNILKPYPVVNNLLPAYVTHVKEREVHAVVHNGEEIIIPWKGLAWARPALKQGYMGRAPHGAAQIITSGDIIYVQNTNDEWQLSQIPQVEAALVALNPENGAIQALVGGLNFPRSKFNRAIQSGRQPGSSFKPFIYAAALNKGYSLASLINDAPIVVDDPSQANLWRPHNVDNQFGGPTRLKEALIRSRNLVSIRILDDIGIDYAADFVSRFGFSKTALPHSLSLALGSLSSSPLELATAYAVFANGGYKIDPFLIDKIMDSEGHVLLQAKPSHVPHLKEMSTEPDAIAPRAIPEDIAFLMHTALMGVVQQGTASQAARILKRTDIAGKTGTTNDQVDAWFCGYNPDLVAVTWIGYDTPISLHEYGSGLALPLWIDFMKTALEGKPLHDIKPPINIITEYINPKTGLLEKNPANGILEYFRDSEIPSNDNAAPESNMTNHQSNQNQESLF